MLARDERTIFTGASQKNSFKAGRSKRGYFKSTQQSVSCKNSWCKQKTLAKEIRQTLKRSGPAAGTSHLDTNKATGIALVEYSVKLRTRNGRTGSAGRLRVTEVRRLVETYRQPRNRLFSEFPIVFRVLHRATRRRLNKINNNIIISNMYYTNCTNTH